MRGQDTIIAILNLFGTGRLAEDDRANISGQPCGCCGAAHHFIRDMN
jgi:hypothetical protein